MSPTLSNIHALELLIRVGKVGIGAERLCRERVMYLIILARTSMLVTHA